VTVVASDLAPSSTTDPRTSDAVRAARLYYFQDLTMAAIGRELGVSRSTVSRLITFARRFGVGANAMIVKKYGFSLTNLMGTAGPDRFIGDLGALVAQKDSRGPVKIHFYTFGGLRATSDWAREYIAAQS